VELKKTVCRFEPFHCTTDTGTNPVPLTVRTTPTGPEGKLLGEIDASVGTGLLVGPLIVKASELETPPPGGGFNTVTPARPPTAMSLSVIDVAHPVL